MEVLEHLVCVGGELIWLVGWPLEEEDRYASASKGDEGGSVSLVEGLDDVGDGRMHRHAPTLYV